MNIKEGRKTTIKFPIQKYFKQIVPSFDYVTFINPFKFWHRYKIDHLEICYEYNLILFLERCLKTEHQSVTQNSENNSISWEKDRGLSSNQQNHNAISISQPNYELKYRGVNYRSNSTYLLNQTTAACKVVKYSGSNEQTSCTHPHRCKK